MAPFEITGKVRDRFIQAAVLLHMLDPVRSEPTVHGLDQDLNGASAFRPQMLKRKFLDSIAFLCATKKDGNSVSAACMEEGLPQGTIIRIASNAGVRENTLCQLRQVLDSLNSVAGAGKLSVFAWLCVSQLVELILYSSRRIHCGNRDPTQDYCTRHREDSILLERHSRNQGYPRGVCLGH